MPLPPDRPAFAEPRHVGRPNVGDRRRLLGADRGSARPQVADERRPARRRVRAARRQAQRHASTASPCPAPRSGCSSSRTRSGSRVEVIVPSFTFIGTAHALSWIGLEPVFCDIDEATHTLDPAAVEERDHAGHERDPRRAPVGRAVRRRRARRHRGAPRAQALLRRRARARIAPMPACRSGAAARRRCSPSTPRRSPAPPRAARSPRTTSSSPAASARSATSASPATTP